MLDILTISVCVYSIVSDDHSNEISGLEPAVTVEFLA